MEIYFSSTNSIVEGIIIGSSGGSIAGLTIWLIQQIQKSYLEKQHKKRIYKWLKENTTNEPPSMFKSSHIIASWNNLTEDRVRFICSIHKGIYLSTGIHEDTWSIFSREERSVYDTEGVKTNDL